MGLGAVVGNTPHNFTAEALERSEISLISGEFRQFLRKHAEAAFRVAEHPSVELHQ